MTTFDGQRVQLKLTVVILMLACLPGVAFAQEEPPEDSADEAPDADEAEARERFRQGLTLANDGDCRGALAEFRVSFELVPRPNTLFNMARCQEELALYDEAITNYERYLQVADAEAEDRSTVERSMRTLNNLLGTLVIESNVPAEIWLGDRMVGTSPGTVRIPGGRHQIELRAESYLSSQQEVDIAGRQTRELRFELEQAEQHIEQTIEQNIEQNVAVTHIEEGGLPPVVFWSTLGITVVAAGVGTVLGIRALGMKSDAELIDARIPRDQEVSDIQDAALLADIFFIGAGVFAAGTVLIYFLTDWDGDQPIEEVPVEVSFGTDRVDAVLRGTF